MFLLWKTYLKDTQHNLMAGGRGGGVKLAMMMMYDDHHHHHVLKVNDLG